MKKIFLFLLNLKKKRMNNYQDYLEWLNEFSCLNGLYGQKRNFSSLSDLMNLEINDTLRELNEISDDEYERRRYMRTTSFVLTSSFKVATDIADSLKLKKLLNNLVKFNGSNFPAHYLKLNSDLLNNFVSLIDFIRYYSDKRNDDNWILVVHHFNKLFISFLICNVNSTTRQIQNEVVLRLLEKWLDIIDATNMDDYEEFSRFLQTRTECLFLSGKHKFINEINSNPIPSPIFTFE